MCAMLDVSKYGTYLVFRNGSLMDALNLSWFEINLYSRRVCSASLADATNREIIQCLCFPFGCFLLNKYSGGPLLDVIFKGIVACNILPRTLNFQVTYLMANSFHLPADCIFLSKKEKKAG